MGKGGKAVDTVSTGPAVGALGKLIEVPGNSIAVVGTYTVGSGPFMVWMTGSQADVVRRALDEWRYTIAASHADNDDAVAVIGQIEERLGR
jgi:hypothetical protein